MSSPARRALFETTTRANRAYYWRVFVPGLGAWQLYADRVWGPYDPASGLRSDPMKVLLDPYGRAVVVPRSLVVLCAGGGNLGRPKLRALRS